MVFLTGSEATRLDSCEVAVVDKSLNCSLVLLTIPSTLRKDLY